MRLDKLVADAASMTRKEAREQIKRGSVEVDGEIIRDAAKQVDEKSELKISGKKAAYSEFIYIMLNKPAGFITATQDKNKQTVFDLLAPSLKRYNLSPVGRLDIDTEGFVLLTNDGQLTHELLSPNKNVGKTYYVELAGIISDSDIEKLETGVNIGFITKPAKVKRLGERAIYLTITEGKFHQIKRMAHEINNEVTYLKRLSYGKLYLDESLEKGAYRRLSDEEIEKIYNVDKIK